MRIGIDLDDVVFDFVNLLLKKYNEKFEKEIFFEEIYDFYFAKIFGMTEEEFNKFFIEIFDKETVINMDLIKDANLILDLFEDEDNKIFFITSRADARNGTIESLNKNFPKTSFKLFFSSNPYCKTEGKNKGEICKDLELDFMIEDDPKHAEDCAKKEIKVLLLDKPWNKNCIEHEKIKRVNNWKEILEKLNGN
jgi:uncharacterized HAD superfamily protein